MTVLVDQSGDMKQIIAAAFDPATQSLKMVSQSSSEITISAATDSITAVPVPLVHSTAGTNALANVVVPPQPASGVGSVALYVTTNTTIVGPQVLTLQVSADGINFVSTTLTVTPSTTAGVTVFAGPIDIAAVSVQVVTAAAITSGTYTATIVNGR